MKAILLIIVSFSTIYLSGCSGCANTDRGERQRANRVETKEPDNRPSNAERNKKWTGITEIKMVSDGGVYKVPVEINNTKMDFIFDTGASSVCISETEARFLIKQGTLSEKDIVGETSFSDANGDVSSGMRIKLKSVQIGNRTLYDVEALIVPNDKAPLLLGQTVLAQFGKISIDYQRGVISFE
jgi:aspartyl protease family protein